MTDAGLCFATGLSYPRYRYILSAMDKLACRTETPDKYPDIQIEHGYVLQRGVLRLISYLQASKSPNDILACKQSWLGGFTDKGAPEASAPSRCDRHTQRRRRARLNPEISKGAHGSNRGRFLLTFFIFRL